MKKEILKQYRDLQKEQKLLEQELERLDCIQSDIVKGSNREFPYEEKIFHIEGKNVVKYNSCRKLLESQKAMCIDMRLQIEEFIAGIKDSQTRMVFRMRYIQNMSWLEISVALGSYNESYARMLHDRYLNKDKLS